MTPEFIAWLKDPSAIRTVLIEVVAQVSGVETTFYLSTKAAYTTGAAETPALTTYRAGASVGTLFTERLSLDGAASLSAGEIEVQNFGGERDAWLGYIWTNRRIRAWIGDPRWPRADFEPIFDGIVADIAPKGRNALAFKLRDKFQRLNAPVTEEKMGGTGPNADMLRPLPLGEVHNMTPRAKADGGWEYSGYGAEGAIESRVEGKPRALTDTPATGSFVLTTAIGPGAITCDVQGVKLGGVYVNTVAKLVEYVVTQCGKPSDRFTSADLDTANLAAFDTAHPQAVGHLVSDRENVIAVCQHLAGSVGAQIVPSRLGLLRLIQLAMPSASTFDIRPKHIKAPEGRSTLVPTGRTDPVGAVKLGFARSFTQQTGLQTSLPEEHKELYATEWSTVTKTDATVIAARKLTAEPVMQPTALIDKAEAETEAQRRLDLWKVPRQCYEFEGEPELLQLELGQAVTVYSALHGMDAGVLATIISLAPDWESGSVKVGFIAWQ